MDLFSWLLIGHLVGDWLLQNNWMASGKARGLASPPLLIHCLLYTGAVAPAIASGLSLPSMGMALATVLVSHWLIDGLALSQQWGRLTRQTESKLVQMGVDQTMHLVVLAAVACWVGG